MASADPLARRETTRPPINLAAPVALLFLAAAANLAAGHKVPEASRCMPNRPLELTDLRLMTPLANKVGRHSAIYLTDKQTVNRLERQQETDGQQAFKNICSGWKPDYAQKSDKIIAFWAYDPKRRFIIPKFVFYNKESYKEIPTDYLITLLSPLFRPVPAYHSMNESIYFNSCQFHYSYYFTVPGLLEMHLLLKSPSSGESQRIPLSSHPIGTTNTRTLSPTLLQHSVPLPHDLDPTSPYQIEISAQPLVLTSVMTPKPSPGPQDVEHVHGIVLANISLSPECFGVNIDPMELERLRQETDREPFKFGYDWTPDTLKKYQDSEIWKYLRHLLTNFTFWLWSFGFLVLLTLAYSQCVVYRNMERVRMRQKSIFGAGPRLRFLWWCECCKKAAQPRRDKVYVTDQDQTQLASFKVVIPGHPEIVMCRNPHYVTIDSEKLRENELERELEKDLESKHLVIDRSRLALTELQLGEGAFGEVYHGLLVCEDLAPNGCGETELDTTEALSNSNSLSATSSHSKKVAVKMFLHKEMTRLEILKEAVLMSEATHQNIVQMLGIVQDDLPCIVMELCLGGNLKDFLLYNRHREGSSYDISPTVVPIEPPENELKGKTRRDPKVELCVGDLLVFALDVARACYYLQRYDLVHRDLAARNCMLMSKVRERVGDHNQIAPDQWAQLSNGLDQVYSNGYRQSGMVVKLGDFGRAREVYTGAYYQTKQKGMPVRWMPPESMDGQANRNSDVWSFGVLLWEMFSMGQLPYQELQNNSEVVALLRKRRQMVHRAAPPEPEAAPPAAPPAELPTPIREEPADAAPGELVPLNSPEAPYETLEDEQPAEQLVQVTEKARAEVSAAKAPPLAPPDVETPELVYELMAKCWNNEPNERPSFREICVELCSLLQTEKVLSARLPSFI